MRPGGPPVIGLLMREASERGERKAGGSGKKKRWEDGHGGSGKAGVEGCSR